MVKVQIGEHNYYLDGILKDNLDTLKRETLKKDWDTFMIIDGQEGSGKSTLAFQIAQYFDHDFNINKIVFDIDQFIEATTRAKKGDCIVFDEVMGYLGSRGSMSKFNRTLIKIFSEMRSKNLFIILCIPSFFELDKYPAIHRSVALIHVYKRGYLAVYNKRKKTLLYVNGKKFYLYKTPPADFIGRFVTYFIPDKKQYETKKQQSINRYFQLTDKEKRRLDQRNKLIIYLYEKFGVTQETIGSIIDISQDQVSEVVRNGKKTQETPEIEVF